MLLMRCSESRPEDGVLTVDNNNVARVTAYDEGMRSEEMAADAGMLGCVGEGV